MTRRRLGYGSAWQAYADAWWTPTPLDRGTKHPPQPDVTGNKPTRYDPGPRDCREWANEFPDGNIMITMPANVIGIDVDAYRGGGGTLAGLAREYGDLPTTWESSSRDDGSGIGLYRVPAGKRLVGKIDPGIEIIQYHHRYAVVWPSVHPEGRVYRWWIGDTSAGIPHVKELPWLPDKWLKALADRKPKATSKDGTPYSGDVGDWLAAHQKATWGQGKAEGIRHLAGDEAYHAGKITRVRGVITRRLEKKAGPQTKKQLRDAVGRDRDYLDEALELLLKDGKAVLDGGKYSLA